MSYIEQSLAPDEHIIYEAHFHPLNNAAAWIALFVSAAVALVAYTQDYSAWVSGAAIALGVAIFLAIKLPIWAQRVVITSQRIVYRRGLLRRKTEELQLRSAEQVQLEQSILGRIFGFGRIIISGTGVEDVRLPALAEPVVLRNKLQEAISGETHSIRV